MKAVNIEWDVDCQEDLEDLPTEIEIPDGMKDEDDISDYLSNVTGFCHKGYNLVESKKKSLSEQPIIKDSSEMLKDVLALKSSNKDSLFFEVDSSSEIVVEVLAGLDGESLEIAIEWRDTKTHKPFECAVCDYNNNEEIEYALDYVRRCAFDGKSEHEKVSLSDQIQSALSRAAESHPTDRAPAKESTIER